MVIMAFVAGLPMEDEETFSKDSSRLFASASLPLINVTGRLLVVLVSPPWAVEWNSARSTG